ncbi:hypothetical protein Turpa_0036 [Turneriella parva DSM 21527]|uniref:Uncharacterized protein n=1 Tax=Turneriella parva (strain ATCC BAA-1111 / DSM 21527 / NCTC 11395 / H) TaxID=869212 RepID=I4B092_TURPD|nr:hypothetical protein Turpa_0036 [Turneriella parva DSM 21527]
MGWKSKPRDDWGHVNQLIQHFNEYARRGNPKVSTMQLHVWGKTAVKLITVVNAKASQE